MTVVSRFVFFTKKKKTYQSSNRIRTNEISIVIPVKDNQKGISNYLHNFLTTHSKDNFPKEIIIVDNNSKRPIVIDEIFKEHGLSIKVCCCKKLGPAAARNMGVANASGSWILFNDSDCIPTKDLLNGYIKADNGSIAYAGNVKSLKSDLLSQYYESQEILLPLKIYEGGNNVPQYLITANA